CNPGNTPQTCRNRQKIGDLSALSAADAVASFSGRVDQTIPKSGKTNRILAKSERDRQAAKRATD
ncbi:hypothetical protein, partial [Xanthomonas vasicola]|uniref:hypothetical protein n=1 Tax=Xanthomonas vasicola TaxID=56459 RepID=UPI001A93A06B